MKHIIKLQIEEHAIGNKNLILLSFFGNKDGFERLGSILKEGIPDKAMGDIFLNDVKVIPVNVEDKEIFIRFKMVDDITHVSDPIKPAGAKLRGLIGNIMGIGCLVILIGIFVVGIVTIAVWFGSGMA